MSNLRVIYEPKGRAREYAELAVNLYRGCGHGCTYCYAPSVLKVTREEFAQPTERGGRILRKLGQDAAQLAKAGDERAILMSFTCDPYQPIEAELRLTRRGIQVLKEHGRRVEILTKGAALAVRDFDLLGPGDAFATTLTFSNWRNSQQWEPNADEPTMRIRSLHLAKARGLRTWASIEPVIDPRRSLTMIWNTLECVDLYKLGAWNYDKRAKEIDWKRYYYHARAMIEKAGKEMFVKQDLLELVDGGKIEKR